MQRAGAHIREQAFAFVRKIADVLGEQSLREGGNRAQWRAQVVRYRKRKRLELAIRDLEFFGAFADVLLEPCLLDAQLPHGQRAFEHGQSGREFDRLLDVIERAGFHRGDRGFSAPCPVMMIATRVGSMSCADFIRSMPLVPGICRSASSRSKSARASP